MALKRYHRENENDAEVLRKREKKDADSASSANKYINKQRVLVFSSRGITTRYRHLMDDIRKLLPHHKKDVKVVYENCFYSKLIILSLCSWTLKINCTSSTRLRRQKDATRLCFWKLGSDRICICG